MSISPGTSPKALRLNNQQMTEDARLRTEKLACKAHLTKDLFGFSLIELLVVISIITVVLAILMPGLGKARTLTRRTKCASNLHQIDVAMHLYLNSNDDTYPCAQDPLPKKTTTDPNFWLWMGRGWRSFIAPHLGGKIDAINPSVLLCPADKIAPVKWESTSYSYSMTFYHSPEQINGMTSNLNTDSPVPQKPVNVAKPDEKMLIGEWLSNHQQIPDGNDQGWWCWQGQRNFLFVDGQVRFLKAKEIRTANDGYPNPNLTTNGVKGSDWPR
jgi:prepilin-type N-terminal cleavage/methylation domain-containing protein/prepilin-type processing-associated H-X9-DG protein